MGHDHQFQSHGRTILRPLLITAGLTIAFLIVEIVAGLLTNSLSLLADAVHMFTDAAGLLLAAGAAWLAQRPANPRKTYGYARAEILAALVNAVLLLVSVIYIASEAIQRLENPGPVEGGPMLIVAVLGLLVNVAGIFILRSGAAINLNARGALYEVLKDALGSVGVIVASGVILLTGWTPIDPLVSIGIALFIVPRLWSLLREAVNVLLEGSPEHLTLAEIRQAILQEAHVTAVHDLHIWAITSGFEVLTGHIVVDDAADHTTSQAILERLSERLQAEFNIDHTTLQIEFRSLAEHEPTP